MSVLVAIPVYNERRYVDEVLARVKQFNDHILLVDDGSTDGTGELLAARRDVHLIRHPRNRGYGSSLIDAFNWAGERGFDWVITMDCDEQHEPEMIPQFKRMIDQDRWDLISGSRYLEQRPDDDMPPGDRRLINSAITEMLNGFLHLGMTDSFCGFKAHRVGAMRRLRLTETGYAFPLQLWPQVAYTGLRLIEIPVRLIYKDPTRHFGGQLDDPSIRLQQYLNVLTDELARLDAEPLATATCCCSGK